MVENVWCEMEDDTVQCRAVLKTKIRSHPAPGENDSHAWKSASTLPGLRLDRLSISLPTVLKLCSEAARVAGIASSLLATGASPPDLSCQKLRRVGERVNFNSFVHCSTSWRPHGSALPPSSSFAASSTQLANTLCTSVVPDYGSRP